MRKKVSSFINIIVVVYLVAITIAMGINNYNSGVYADAHGLDGAKVGWFAPDGVLVFVISAVGTITFAIYIFLRFKSQLYHK